eukprot:TRINITY_DN36530_c0_g1_i1.p1 TRINITY_DN36530_c0_g1~~TRINITY_DN36530_c0_g1_i1.p1  ORF type:complete len:159 (+),score=63.08 TRINITY_DN36530_c0_g1_i1:71-478(+)
MGFIVLFKMRTFLAIITTLACVQGNALQNQKCPIQGAELVQRLARLQIENINLKRAAGEEVSAASLGLPPSTDDCDWGTGLTCVTDIGWAVWECSSVIANPLEIVSCVEDVIGAGHDCWACICWVVESLLGDGYC